jgi:hypothetical protein
LVEAFVDHQEEWKIGYQLQTGRHHEIPTEGEGVLIIGGLDTAAVE